MQRVLWRKIEEEDEEDEPKETEDEEESEESEEKEEPVRNQIANYLCSCGHGLDGAASNHYCIHTGKRRWLGATMNHGKLRKGMVARLYGKGAIIQ
jgi:hypothetical protein